MVLNFCYFEFSFEMSMDDWKDSFTLQKLMGKDSCPYILDVGSIVIQITANKTHCYMILNHQQFFKVHSTSPTTKAHQKPNLMFHNAMPKNDSSPTDGK